LILGDELCSGTETTSALCIITAGLNTLCNRGSTFIFTSHLHELTKLEEVKSLTNLNVYHLKIDYDKEKDILIYDRKLEEGSGPSIYGLKVCEAMGLTKEFISYAKGVQNNFEKNNILTTKKSQYNKEIFMDECKMCFKKCDDLETHHIKDQQFADKNNMIDGHHKNVKHNLVPLCKGCHLKVTNGEVVMDGWKKTNQGKILIWRNSEKKVVIKKKFSEDQVKEILTLKEENQGISQKDFIKKLELENNIKLSVSTLKKMIDDIY
jgi:DNA mismatch repair protein MutS